MPGTSLRVLFELHRATHNVGLTLGAIEGTPLTQAEAIVLAYLREQGSSTMTDLHHAFGHRRSTLTSVVDRLVSRGLANRDLSSSDRRSFVVSLTHKGAGIATKVRRKLGALERDALRGLSETHVASVLEVLNRLGNSKASQD